MLSDEEKESIEEFRKQLRLAINIDDVTTAIRNDNAQTILNLIEKQQKEIEELKKPKYILNCKTNEITKLTNDFVSKDKIKEILGIEDIDNEKILSLLQTIVDENARLEDIEDRKVQIEYNNVFNKGVKSVEDKIKAKIEIRKEEKENCKDSNEEKYLLREIYVLQSLLEKE